MKRILLMDDSAIFLEVMRDALTAYLASTPAAPASAWSLGADLFGRHAGPADLATARRTHAGDAWAQKHARRTAP